MFLLLFPRNKSIPISRSDLKVITSLGLAVAFTFGGGQTERMIYVRERGPSFGKDFADFRWLISSRNNYWAASKRELRFGGQVRLMDFPRIPIRNYTTKSIRRRRRWPKWAFPIGRTMRRLTNSKIQTGFSCGRGALRPSIWILGLLLEVVELGFGKTCGRSNFQVGHERKSFSNEWQTRERRKKKKREHLSEMGFQYIGPLSPV